MSPIPPVPIQTSVEPSATDILASSMSEMDSGFGDGSKRLIVVSNRLPVTISKDDKGEYHFKMSSGGLVSALSGCKKYMSFTWIGWPGFYIPVKDRPIVDKRLAEEFSCQAVYLTDDVAERHYNGFSNSILWPLFHYHPGEMNFDEANWLAYKQANLKFARVVRNLLQDGDMVWVQDYHLMLMPAMLRNLIGGAHTDEEDYAELERTVKEPEAIEKVEPDHPTVNGIKVGFFLHTPFPSSEIYRILPVRREILLGVLHCDLIGFHTYDYARHFLSSCTRVLGVPTMPNGLVFEGRYAHVGTYPIGIDPEQFTNGLETPLIKERLAALERRFSGVKVIVGVDRLDYIKGVPQKMHALEVFLSQHPEWVGKVVLVQLAVPSRGDVEEYQNLRATVNELVGRINGRFGTIEFMPIHFMHKSLAFPDLVALYAVSDVCLVTSTRDGMNLVSYEYIACQDKRNGVMILSEFAGAAQSLNGSLVVNPWDSQAVADAIHEAVTMDPEVRKTNQQKLSKYVQKYSAAHWGTSFVKDLTALKMGKENEQALVPPKSAIVDGEDEMEISGEELPHATAIPVVVYASREILVPTVIILGLSLLLNLLIMSLWVDKYRPRSLDELHYHPALSERLKSLAASGDFPHMLFYGPSGAGKKTRIACTLRQLFGPGVEKLKIDQRVFMTPSKRKLDVNIVQSNYHLEITPSDVGIYDRVVIQEILKEIAQTQQVDLNAKQRFKVVIINEADSLTRDAQAALRRTMEKYMSNMRLILCANSTSKLIAPIKSRCLLVRVAAPSVEEMHTVLNYVAKKERIDLPQDAADEIIEDSDGNLRKAILVFEALKMQSPDLSSNLAIAKPDWETYCLKVSDMIVREQTPEKVLEVRTKLYELLSHCIPPTTIIKTIAYGVAAQSDEAIRAEIMHWAALYEVRMRIGSKKIFHLEAWVVKAMSITKHHLLGMALSDSDDFNDF